MPYDQIDGHAMWSFAATGEENYYAVRPVTDTGQTLQRRTAGSTGLVTGDWDEGESYKQWLADPVVPVDQTPYVIVNGGFSNRTLAVRSSAPYGEVVLATRDATDTKQLWLRQKWGPWGDQYALINLHSGMAARMAGTNGGSPVTQCPLDRVDLQAVWTPQGATQQPLALKPLAALDQLLQPREGDGDPGTKIVADGWTAGASWNSWYFVPANAPKLAETLTDLENIVRGNAPIMVLAPGEQYLPCFVEWYLQRADLVSKDGTRRPADQGPLPTTGSDYDYWMALRDPADRAGDLASAVSYVHVRPAPDPAYTDVRYWTFYAFNGPGTASLSGSERVSLAPVGEHEGDWEYVTLRFDNVTRTLVAVFLSQHAGGEWITDLTQFSRVDGRIVVYASRNGHAAYHDVGAHSQKIILCNDTGEGQRFDTASFRWLAADIPLDRSPPSPPWLDYPCRWGVYEEYSLEYILGTLGTILAGVPGGVAITTISLLLRMGVPELFFESGPTGPKMKGTWAESDDGNPTLP